MHIEHSPCNTNAKSFQINPVLASPLSYLLPPWPRQHPSLVGIVSDTGAARTALHPPLLFPFPRSKFKGTTTPTSSSSSSLAIGSHPRYLHLQQALPPILLLRLRWLSSSPPTSTLTHLAEMPPPGQHQLIFLRHPDRWHHSVPPPLLSRQHL